MAGSGGLCAGLGGHGSCPPVLEQWYHVLDVEVPVSAVHDLSSCIRSCAHGAAIENG